MLFFVNRLFIDILLIKMFSHLKYKFIQQSDMTNNIFKLDLEKLNYYAFLLLAFSLNFPQTVIKFTFGFWLITCIFSIDSHRKATIKEVYYIPLLLLSLLIIGRIIVSLIHNDFPSLMSKLLDTQLALLVLPVLIILHANRYFNLKQVLFFYLIGCITSCIIAVSYFYLYRYNILSGTVEGIPLGTYTHKLADDISLFQLFISPFFKHRAAMGANISLAVGSLAYLVKSANQLSFFRIVATFITILILSAVLYSTGSRSGIISLTFVLFASAVYIFKRKRIIFIVFALIGLSIAGLSTLKATRIIDKGVTDYQKDMSKVDPRIQIWKCAIEIIRDHPLLGVGYSKVKPELYEKYKEDGLTSEVNAKHNSHNQFLQFALESGIGVSLIFMFILLPIYFEKRVYFLSLSFSSTFFIYSMFEDSLIIINGLTIFVFFIALLTLSQKQFTISR